jgi:hypothetical protein
MSSIAGTPHPIAALLAIARLAENAPHTDREAGYETARTAERAPNADGREMPNGAKCQTARKPNGA